MPPPHRKRKVTYNIPGHVHFLTFSCQKRLPLLDSDLTRGWFIEALANARSNVGFDLWAFVIMPEHVHLLIRPRESEVGRILAAIKRPVSAAAKQYLCDRNATSWLQRLTVVEGGEEVFRFWQAGGGYDKNLTEEKAIQEIIAYIHANPVRRGLVEQPEQWYWSSARYWAGDLSGPLTMDSLEL
jgi:putative transposase